MAPDRAQEIVDARGLVVSPGFIDIQSHSTYALMIDGRCLSKITQGVTTENMGESRTPAPRPAGSSTAPAIGGARAMASQVGSL
ncbi:MAG: hypothetical protein JOZ41_04035 [Chloroflexi bacterium]|nr:hypothetical protein [Chloroflexota bacterium]